MADDRTHDELTDDELEGAHAEPLPDREQMSVIKPEPYPEIPAEPWPPFYTIDPPPPDEA